jgi:thiamine biosynthesis lipoprotein
VTAALVAIALLAANPEEITGRREDTKILGIRTPKTLRTFPSSCKPPAPSSRHEAARVSMGCTYGIVWYGDESAAVAALDEVDRIDRLMSHYRPDSPLSLVNREAAARPVAVDAELFDFLALCQSYARESAGAFDVTVGPLMHSWGFFEHAPHVPSPRELARARTAVGDDKLRLDAAARTVRFAVPGMSLDLGGIAKGYAVDRAIAVLRAHGVDRALVSAGGSTVYALGAPPDAPAWQVHLPLPLGERTFDVKDEAISVAGLSQQSFRQRGVRHGHIMDPRTGWPVRGVDTVVVAAPTATEGDAIDDVLFVLGRDGARAYLAAHPGPRLLAWIDGDGQRAAGPRSARPGRAPVGSPSAQTATPLTSTDLKPSE